MAWKVEFTQAAGRDLDQLDPSVARRVLKFMVGRVAQLDDPRSIGEALRGPRWGDCSKYRVGDYRLICALEDARVLILVLRIGNRREVYR
jgi:mRNA interferase RelE/StbE